MQVGAAWGAHLSPPCIWPWWPVVSGCRRLSPWSSLRCSSASSTSPCTSSLKISYMPASWKLWVWRESGRPPANVLRLTVNYCMDHILYFNLNSLFQLESWPGFIHSKFNYTVYSIRFPSENAAEWKKLFKPCASQRLFLPVSVSLKKDAFQVFKAKINTRQHPHQFICDLSSCSWF